MIQESVRGRDQTLPNILRTRGSTDHRLVSEEGGQAG